MYYRSQDAELFYDQCGAGPDLVLLHPTPVDHTFWIPAARILSSGYRVLLPDLRGHGQSQAGEGVISIDRLGSDILRLLDTVRAGKALFAGCSIGSYLLYELWRRAPGRIRALAFCCGKPQPDAAANRAKRMEDIEKIGNNGTAEFFDRTIGALVGPAFQRREPAKTAFLREVMNRMPPESVIAVQEGLSRRPDSVPTLPTISVPVLALAAADDPASTPQEMEVIPRLVPGARYELLPDAGHYAPYEQPETVAEILCRFFESVPE